jgi:hypothetical protein
MQRQMRIEAPERAEFTYIFLQRPGELFHEAQLSGSGYEAWIHSCGDLAAGYYTNGCIIIWNFGMSDTVYQYEVVFIERLDFIWPGLA